MGTWGPTIFADDLGLDIRREYSFLLSVGKENHEAEQLLMKYYAAILNCNDPDEDVFWFTLALCEWKKGQLSTFVKEKALEALDSGHDLERWASDNPKDYKKRTKVLENLRNTILSPMQPAKKLKKPKMRLCPWQAGSLLAYRIVANQRLKEKNHPCYGKYVLLRIVKIVQHPASKILSTEYFHESMVVGLYNWIGDVIPDPAIAEQLEYIPITESTLQMPKNRFDLSLANDLSEESQQRIEEVLRASLRKRVETCVYLDWESTKDMVGNLTYLSCDKRYAEHTPEFFDTSILSCSICSFASFDVTLAKKFKCVSMQKPMPSNQDNVGNTQRFLDNCRK